jgi:hypothetical protein
LDQYPKWKYTQGDACIVNDEAEEHALEGDWHDCITDVPELVPELTEEQQLLIDATAEKADLLAKAAELNVTVDKRWGITKIKDALATAAAVQIPPVHSTI